MQFTDSLKEIVAQTDTEDAPFFVIDESEIEHAYNLWMSCLANVTPYYAVKCNPDQRILRACHRLGVNFDCASEHEMMKVMELGTNPKRIIFANPCKMPSHIRYACNHGVQLMTFDCVDELQKIKRLFPKARLLLRLAVDDSKAVCQFNTKFGCTLCEVDSILQCAFEMGLDVVGFSFHVGSGCQDPIAYYTAIADCKTATNMLGKFGFTAEIIDVGGGFPGDDVDKFKDIAAYIKQGIRDFFGDSGDIKYIAEPGRFFAQKACTLLMTVTGKKNINEHKVYYVSDGVYGSFNCIHYDHYTPAIRPLVERPQRKQFKSTVFGPTCDSMDVIYENVDMPELSVGEWLYVSNFGAYTMSAASNFNGFNTEVRSFAKK